jgi:hypothetical protein
MDNLSGTVIRETEFVMTMNLDAIKSFEKILHQAIEQVEQQLASINVTQTVKQ